MNEQTDKHPLIPIYVLTGFLGSGKTTLLNRILEEARVSGRKVAVLLNEAGEANVEGQLIADDVPMAEMLGGCICCSIRADLGLELTKLAREHRPDAIWIESTGVAKPFEIVDSVTEASLYERMALTSVVGVADARHLLDRVRVGSGKTLRLMREQLSAADLVLLNKADLVGEAELAELTELLGDWNPVARIVPTVKSDIDPAAIYSGRRSAREMRGGHDEGCAPDCDHHHDHDHVNALTYYLPGPVDSAEFEALVRSLPEGVYRGKGIVSFRDTASRFLFQYAYKESDYLRITPQKTVHDVVVFIGENFSRDDLTRRLERLARE